MKTTAKDFKTYKAHCKKWQEKLGLTNWELNFYHNDDEEGARAWVEAFIPQGQATIGLTETLEDRRALGGDDLNKWAMHEITELMLWKIRKLLEPVYSEEVINQHIHDIIRRLENVFFSD